MKRLGFHYFPDTQHYRQSDLRVWLPRLESLGVHWLILKAPSNRAIPEGFIRALIESNIQPLLHIPIQLSQIPALDDLMLIFTTYRRWGVRYMMLFDQPNTHKVWQAATWAQADLVERFLDLYLPLANTSINAGLTPIFPPLKPGGDYWDTAFLRRALQSLRRRAQHNLLEQLVLGAYSYPGTHPIQWGAGGPERWPNARPYFTPPGVEDQRGFRIFDWYAAIGRAALSFEIPIFLFGMGYSSDVENQINRNITISRLLHGEFIEGYEAIPKEVIGGAFESLVDLDCSSNQGWFNQNGDPYPQAEKIRQLVEATTSINQSTHTVAPTIRHYLLLPSYDWGISDYHLDIIRPIIKKCQPTIGFSIAEAQNAKRVTVFGGEAAFSEASLNILRAEGAMVTRINEDGTNIASYLATL